MAIATRNTNEISIIGADGGVHRIVDCDNEKVTLEGCISVEWDLKTFTWSEIQKKRLNPKINGELASVDRIKRLAVKQIR